MPCNHRLATARQTRVGGATESVWLMLGASGGGAPSATTAR